MKKILLITLFFLSYTFSAQNLKISEIMISPPGTDSPNEFIELRGDPGATIAAGTYLIGIEGDSDGSNNPGKIQANSEVIDLSGLTIGSNGYLVLLTTGHPYTTNGYLNSDAAVYLDLTDGTIEDKSNTLLLINSPTTPTSSIDIDDNDDGIPNGTDYASWTILDGISMLDDDDFAANGEFGYASTVICHCTSGDDIKTIPGASILYTGTRDMDYAGRIGESTGNIVTNDKSNSDWFTGDLSSADEVAGTWTLSTGTNGTQPEIYEGLDLNNIGGPNHVMPNTWTGATNNDWDTASNWSYTTVPVLTEFVSIPNGLTNYPTAASATTVKFLTIESGASLIANDDFTGSTTYNRTVNFVSGNLNGWYLMASPLLVQSLNDSYITGAGIATNGLNTGVAAYNTSADSWTYHQQATSTTLDTGKGYSIKRATTTGNVYFKGSVNTNNAGVDVTLSNAGNRFNLLGNPYTSYLSSAYFLDGANAESVVSETKTIWVFNQTLGTNGEYEVKTVGNNFMISPGQGFFVKANAAGGTFNFDESNQNHNIDTFQKSLKTEILINISDGNINNYAKMYYINNATTGLDIGYDGELFGGIPSSFSVYSELVTDNVGKKYQVQSLPNSNYESMIIPLGLNANANKEITFTVNSQNLPNGINVYLEDRLLNTFTRLDEANTNYKVTLGEASNGTGRFYIHTASKALSTDTEILSSVSIYKTNNDNLRIAGLQNEKATVSIFNILGKQVLSTSFTANGAKDITLPSLAKGVYIVQLQSNSGKLSKKIILE